MHREAKMPRITINYLHRHLRVLPRTFVPSTSRPTQLLLQHRVLHIRYSALLPGQHSTLGSSSYSGYQHLLDHPTSLSRARPTANNERGARRASRARLIQEAGRRVLGCDHTTPSHNSSTSSSLVTATKNWEEGESCCQSCRYRTLGFQFVIFHI